MHPLGFLWLQPCLTLWITDTCDQMGNVKQPCEWIQGWWECFVCRAFHTTGPSTPVWRSIPLREKCYKHIPHRAAASGLSPRVSASQPTASPATNPTVWWILPPQPLLQAFSILSCCQFWCKPLHPPPSRKESSPPPLLAGELLSWWLFLLHRQSCLLLKRSPHSGEKTRERSDWVLAV